VKYRLDKEYIKQEREKILKIIGDRYEDGDGRVVLNFNLYDGLNLYNPLSESDSAVLDVNTEIADYLEEKIRLVETEKDIIVHFSGQKLSEEEQEKFKGALHNHYLGKLYFATEEYKVQIKSCIQLAIIAVIMIALYLYLCNVRGDRVGNEIISIIGSFAMWEALGIILLQRLERRVMYRRIVRILKSEIRFD